MLDEIAAAAARVGEDTGIKNFLEEVTALTGMDFVGVARVTETRWITCQVLDQIYFAMSPGEDLRISTTIRNDVRER